MKRKKGERAENKELKRMGVTEKAIKKKYSKGKERMRGRNGKRQEEEGKE